jgi:hypothetical protein
MSKKFKHWKLVKYKSEWFITFVSSVFYYCLLHNFFDNSVISSFLPTASDSQGYVRRAEILISQGFNEAFKDCYRMPGYSMLLALSMKIFPNEPFLAMRIFQAILSSLSLVVIYRTLRVGIGQISSLITSLVLIIFPIWYFIPILIAESVSIFLCVLVTSIIIRTEGGFETRRIVCLAFLVATAIYLKPNNLFLGIAVAITISMSFEKRKTLSIGKFTFTLLSLLLPWILFVSKWQPGFVGLTTNAGGNMYFGTGMVLDYDNSSLARAALRWKVDPKNNPEDVIPSSVIGTEGQWDNFVRDKAFDIWEARPINQIGFGIEKILISFGILPDNLQDLLYGFTAISVLFYLLFLNLRKLRSNFTNFASVGISLLALQSFIFQADKRFTLPFLFTVFAVLLGNVVRIALTKTMLKSIVLSS